MHGVYDRICVRIVCERERKKVRETSYVHWVHRGLDGGKALAFWRRQASTDKYVCVHVIYDIFSVVSVCVLWERERRRERERRLVRVRPADRSTGLAFWRRRVSTDRYKWYIWYGMSVCCVRARDKERERVYIRPHPWAFSVARVPELGWRLTAQPKLNIDR